MPGVCGAVLLWEQARQTIPPYRPYDGQLVCLLYPAETGLQMLGQDFHIRFSHHRVMVTWYDTNINRLNGKLVPTKIL